MHHPILQLQQLGLQPQQFAEIEAAVDPRRLAGLLQGAQLGRDTTVVDLLLQLLIEIILQFEVEPGFFGRIGHRFRH